MSNFICISVIDTLIFERKIIELEIPKGEPITSTEVLNFIMGCSPTVFEVDHVTNKVIGIYKINFYNNNIMQIMHCEYRSQPIDNTKYKIGPYTLYNFSSIPINKQEKYIKEEYEVFLEKHKLKEEKQDYEEQDLYDEILF